MRSKPVKSSVWLKTKLAGKFSPQICHIQYVFGSRLRHCKAADPVTQMPAERNAVLIDVGSWWWYARGDPPRVRRTAGHPRGSRPEPGPDGAVVRVTACGVCRSDWHAWAGHGEWADDRVPADRCSATSPPAKWLPSATPSTGSRRATASSFRSRSATAPVRAVGRGHGNVCDDGRALGFEPEAPGAFAERVAVPDADYNLVERPPWLDATAAAALGCRYMTAYHALAERAGLDGGEWLAVHGCGGVGLGSPTGRRARGTDRRGRCRRRRPRSLAIWGRRDCESERPRRGDGSGPGSKPHRRRGTTFLWTRSVSPRRAATRSGPFAPAGPTQQVGLTTEAERGEVSLPTDWMTRWEVSFVGSRGMPPTSYDDLFALVEATDVDPAALVSEELALSEVSERLAAMGEYDARGVEVVTDFGR